MNPRITIQKDTRTIRKKPWLVRWYAEYDPVSDTRKRHSKSFETRKQAQRFSDSLKDIHPSDPFFNPVELTLSQLCEKFLYTYKAAHKEKTQEGYRDTIRQLKNRFGETFPIQKITHEKAERFILSIDFLSKQCKNKGKRISDSTRSRYLRQSKTMFKKAVRWGYLKQNPFEDIKLGKISKQAWYYITPDDFYRLLEGVDKTPTYKPFEQEILERKIRIRALYSIMYGCGLRFGEAVNLTWDDNIDLENRQVRVCNRQGTDSIPAFFIKDYESRSLPIPKWVCEKLSELKSIADKGSPFVFLTQAKFQQVCQKWQSYIKQEKTHLWNSNEMMHSALHLFYRACNRAGLKTDKKLNIHCLRKGYGTNLANLGTPAHTLKDLMGHSSIVTTMEYYIYSPDANKTHAAEQLDRLMGNRG